MQPRPEDIVYDALQLDIDERQVYVERACGGDASLLSQIQSLLAVHERYPGCLLLTPVSDEVFEDSPPSFSPGEVLAGRYRLDEFLARGGMGEVYRAEDMELGVVVALKTLRPEIASDPTSLRRFKQEVLLARSVTHPNVCRIFDLGRHRDERRECLFLTMEFLPGDTLSARIREGGPLAREVALPLVRQIADAWDAAHRAGIVHRDFKSPNVMVVTAEGGERAVITDFGLAIGMLDTDSATPPVGSPDSRTPGEAESPTWRSERREGEEHTIGPLAIAGTPDYMAPEQVRGEHVGSAADLYALGVVLFEMTTGVLPFHRGTPMDTARAHLWADPPLPSSLHPTDPSWEAAILKLLARAPGDRFQNAGEAVRALEGVQIQIALARHNLPAERDTFVGRVRELETVASKFDTGVSALTILGPGGTGKTRLARQYGWNSLGRWSGGVWFCDLSEARTIDGVAFAVATALDLSLGKGDSIAQLGAALAARDRSLVILDNVEQVAKEVVAALERWLAVAPDTRFLITSRERLHLEAEAVFELEPLDPQREGLELFELRASAQRPDFVITGKNRETTSEIVRLLDGLPLAIELAVAKLRALSLEQLRDRLRDRLGVLTSPRRGRQGTLRATLDWSWDLLQPWEQAAIAQASVFEGGFTLDAAESVLDFSAWRSAPQVVDLVQSLVDKSWLRVQVVRDAPRFSMYGSVQEYTAEKLRSDGAIADGACAELEATRVETRHGEYYAQMGADRAIEALDGPGGIAKRWALGNEVDNLAAAIRRASTRGDGLVAWRAFAAAWAVLQLQGPLSAAVALGQQVVAMRIPDPELAVRALDCLGNALRMNGQKLHESGVTSGDSVEKDARQCYQDALAIVETVGDRRLEGAVIGGLAILDHEQGRIEDAHRNYERALAINQEFSDRRREGNVLGSLGVLHYGQGRPEEARRCYEQAIAIHREVGNLRSEGMALANLGVLHRQQGRLEEARRHYEQALVIHQEIGNRRSEGITLGYLLGVLQEQGQLAEATKCGEEVLAIHREVRNRRYEGIALEALGVLSLDQGRWDDADRYLAEALSIHREIGNRSSEGLVLSELGRLRHAEGKMDEAREHYDASLVVHRELGSVWLQAGDLTNLGTLSRDLGNGEEARRCYLEALDLHRRAGNRASESSVLRLLAVLEANEGRTAEAEAALTTAETLIRDLGNPIHAARLCCARAECARIAGNTADAHRHLQDATTIADAAGMPSESDLRKELVQLSSRVGLIV